MSRTQQKKMSKDAEIVWEESEIKKYCGLFYFLKARCVHMQINSSAAALHPGSSSRGRMLISPHTAPSALPGSSRPHSGTAAPTGRPTGSMARGTGKTCDSLCASRCVGGWDLSTMTPATGC